MNSKVNREQIKKEIAEFLEKMGFKSEDVKKALANLSEKTIDEIGVVLNNTHDAAQRHNLIHAIAYEIIAAAGMVGYNYLVGASAGLLATAGISIPVIGWPLFAAGIFGAAAYGYFKPAINAWLRRDEFYRKTYSELEPQVAHIIWLLTNKDDSKTNKK